MEKKLRYTLGKHERLKSRKAIEQLFKVGRSFSVFPFRVIYLLPTTDDGRRITEKAFLQAGFTVSSKNFKHAVDRNRVKRLMREGYRLQKNELHKQVLSGSRSLSVFFIFNGKEVPDYDFVFSKMTKALKQLQKLLNEDPAPNN